MRTGNAHQGTVVVPGTLDAEGAQTRMTMAHILVGVLVAFPVLAPFLLGRLRNGLVEMPEEPAAHLQRLCRAQGSLLNLSLCSVVAAFLLAVPHQGDLTRPNWLHVGMAAAMGGLLAGWCAGGTTSVCRRAEEEWGRARLHQAGTGSVAGTALATALILACGLLMCHVFWQAAARMDERLTDLAPLMAVTAVLAGMLWGPSLLVRVDGPQLEDGMLLDRIRATAEQNGIALSQVIVDDAGGYPAMAAFPSRDRTLVLSPRLVQGLEANAAAALACSALAELEARTGWEQVSRLRALACASAWLGVWGAILNVAASLEEGRGIYSPTWLAVLLAGASLGGFVLTTLVVRRRRNRLHRRAAHLAGDARLYLAAHVHAAIEERRNQGDAPRELTPSARRHLQALAATLSLPAETVSEALPEAPPVLGSSAPPLGPCLASSRWTCSGTPCSSPASSPPRPGRTTPCLPQGARPHRTSRLSRLLARTTPTWTGPCSHRIRVAWRALLAGEGDAATLRGLLVQARFEVEKKEQMLADSLGTSHDPDPLQQALQEAMHAQTETVARLQGLPGAGQETVEAALQEAQEAANRLDTLLRQGEECQEALIVVTCPRCGVRCADDATRCACCGSIIPSLQP